ncbi:MAG: hypothetical protein KDK91_04160, partial [Gammaproteobacteria bacterium]|nr:hypothetical protein [Gammaproteobacteria bacterium]
GVAHEINNPIGFVKSNLGSLDHYTGQLLGLARLCRSLCESDDDEAAMRDALRAELERIELTYLEEDLREVLAESRDGIERVTNIVHDLDEFSRRDRAQWEHADLLRCIEATVRLAHSAVKAGVEVSLDFEPLPDIECMPSQLNQVFMNLIVNAAQAVGDQGRIVIRGRAHGDRVHLEFEDNGSGIESNIIGRIFDPFFTTRPVGSGSGLGLSIAHGIIEQHGGGIEVRSVPDQGTCFTVTLPIQRRPEACLSRQDVALAEHAA